MYQYHLIMMVLSAVIQFYFAGLRFFSLDASSSTGSRFFSLDAYTLTGLRFFFS